MIRKMIQIDEEKCNGCGLCADACHEGAIGIIDGKAKLLRDDYCDGLGDCLPVCPMGAITFVEREADAYDKAAVLRRQKQAARSANAAPAALPSRGTPQIDSALRQWPVQIKLAPVCAPYFDGAHLLIAADCSAYAYGSFHTDFIRGRVALIGCPKLDGCDYTEKLAGIIRQNDIKSITVVRMEVPCCGGIEHAAAAALKISGKWIPWQAVAISTGGQIL